LDAEELVPDLDDIDIEASMQPPMQQGPPPGEQGAPSGGPQQGLSPRPIG
jgi:hypothetical protein